MVAINSNYRSFLWILSYTGTKTTHWLYSCSFICGILFDSEVSPERSEILLAEFPAGNENFISFILPAVADFRFGIAVPEIEIFPSAADFVFFAFRLFPFDIDDYPSAGFDS